MLGVNRTLRASTLVETLVMMLVAGIIFLTVMDGLTLFTRLQTQRADALLTTGRQRDGYYRTLSLIAGADSIRSHVPGQLELYRQNRQSVLSVSDSALFYVSGEFHDTLLTHVGALQLWECAEQPDTVKIQLAAGFVVKIPVLPSERERYCMSIEEIEQNYDYEE